MTRVLHSQVEHNSTILHKQLQSKDNGNGFSIKHQILLLPATQSEILHSSERWSKGIINELSLAAFSYRIQTEWSRPSIYF